MDNFKLNSIEEAIEDIKQGKIIIVVDDEDRENEGDLLCAAELVTGESINFMAKYGRGLICMPCEETYLKKLKIMPMVEENTDNHQTAFTVSIDEVSTTTGISAYERANTILKVLDSKASENDFRKPGHIFPLIGREGGVLKRAGHTEAAIDLAKLAGLKGAGVICEIMQDDGEMARLPKLIEYANEFNLKIISIEKLIEYRQREEILVDEVAKASMPTKYGEFSIHGFVNKINGEHHVALVKGEINPEENILVRVHSECLTGDALGSCRCDCGEQYDAAMKAIANEGKGILLYMRQEGRGIGLINKLKAYELQDRGLDTVEANIALGFKEDLREYGIGAQILKVLGAKNINLMTNNPTKVIGLKGYGLNIANRIPLIIEAKDENKFYMETKKTKMNHLI